MLGSPVVYVSVKKDSLLVYVLKFFGILAGRCGSAVVRERDRDTKAPGWRSGFDPALRFSFFLKETLSITGQKCSKCLKNGSDRLRKGQLRCWAVPEYKVSTLYSGTKVDTGSLSANRFHLLVLWQSTSLFSELSSCLKTAAVRAKWSKYVHSHISGTQSLKRSKFVKRSRQLVSKHA